MVKVEADPTTTATNQNSNGWGLKIVDYFTPYNVNALDDADEDFGSGSPLVLPDSAGIPGHPHLHGGRRQGRHDLPDRPRQPGKFNVNDDDVLNSVYNPSTGITTPPVLINGSLSTPAYYHGTIYWVSGYNSNAWSYIVAPNPAPAPPTVPVADDRANLGNGQQQLRLCPRFRDDFRRRQEDPAGGIVWIMDTRQRRAPCLQYVVTQHRIVDQRPGQHRGGQVRGAHRGQRPGLRRHAGQPAGLRAHRAEYAGPGAQRPGQRQRTGALGLVR